MGLRQYAIAMLPRIARLCAFFHPSILPVLSFLALPALGPAQDSRWGIRLSLYECQPIFSSEDLRQGIGIAVDYAMPYRRLRFRSNKGELVLEAHYDFSASKGFSGRPPDTADGYGLMAFGRYRGHSRKGTALYVELGWGFYYAPKLTLDLDNHFNSTPTIGLGAVMRSPTGNESFLGLRLMHVSNGGLAKGNQGQNRLQVTLGVKL